MSSTTVYRGKNVTPQETQALLRACLELNVEQVRRTSGRISHLFYDVQQHMNKNGPYPERKLFILQRNYLRAEQDFKSGKLKPYPPEARELWGKSEHDDDDVRNDRAWKERIAKAIKRKSKTLHKLCKQETEVMISECLKRNIEKLPAERLYDTFALIVRKLQNKKLFLGRTTEELQRVYNALKKRYQQKKNSAEFPELAAKLWEKAEDKAARSSSSCSEKSNCNTQESFAVKTESIDCNESKIKNICRVCRTEDLLETKHLFKDAYQNQTYAEIIYETIHVKMVFIESDSFMLCQSCASYIERLTTFVRQCQEHCEGSKITDDYPIERSSQSSLPVVLVKSEVPDTNEIWISTEFEDFKSENIKSNDDCLGSVFDENSADADCPMDSSSDEREVDDAKQHSTLSTEELNQLRFQESRGILKVDKICDICGKTVRDLYCHMAVHADANFACDFCHKKFPEKRRLMIHRNMHTKEKSYPCSYCEKVFYIWKSRQDHEKTHITKTNNLSYSCNQCDAVYKVEKSLQLHVRNKHLGIKNMHCKKCDFSTFVKFRLLNHVRRIHTEERPYLCPLCGFTSNSSSGYFVHFQRHKKNGEVTGYTIRCAYCNDSYSKDSALEKHIVAKHPDRAVLV